MKQTITLGGGCFWCTEAILLELRGVKSVVSGYSGGQTENPTYEQVSSGRTGHAEVAEVTFDPSQISLHDLLVVFFTLHDPTTRNRQGNDVGTQYRSIVLYRNEEQKQITEQVVKEISDQKVWLNPIVTEIVPFEKFYPAENYHQNYFAQNQSQPYCQLVIEPKVLKLRAKFTSMLKAA